MLSPVLLLILAAQAAAQEPQVLIQKSAQDVRPVRLAATAFGQSLEIEVRGLTHDKAMATIQAALSEVTATERLLRPDTAEPAGGVGALNAASGHGPQPVSPDLMPLLVRAQELCYWVEGTHGPLGRPLYEAWGLAAPLEGTRETVVPEPRTLDEAISAANCDHLVLSVSKSTATLAEGSRIDLTGFAEGQAVDRAVDVLKRNGVTNGFVQLGPVQRAFGGGLDGKGWRIVLPKFSGMEHSPGRFFLKDRSVAILSTADASLHIADQVMLPYLNQRTGLPAPGVVGMVAVTELAVDAQALAVAMVLTGPGEGQLRMGSLRPNPSLLWFLGSGSGVPLQVEHRWGDVLVGGR